MPKQTTSGFNECFERILQKKREKEEERRAIEALSGKGRQVWRRQFVQLRTKRRSKLTKKYGGVR